MNEEDNITSGGDFFYINETHFFWLIINIIILYLFMNFIKYLFTCRKKEIKLKDLYEYLEFNSNDSNNENNCLSHWLFDFENNKILSINVCKISDDTFNITIEGEDPYDFYNEGFYFRNINNNREIVKIEDTIDDRKMKSTFFDNYKINIINNEKISLCNKMNNNECIEFTIPYGYAISRNNNDSISISRRSPCEEDNCKVKYGDYCTFYARFINKEIQVPEWNSDQYNKIATNLYWKCKSKSDQKPILKQCKININK